MNQIITLYLPKCTTRVITKIKQAKYTFKKVGNYWNAEEIEMTDLKKNHRTKMQMSEIKYDSGLSDDDFTVRKLKQ
ncbi:MAG: outer membrane lipoprotein-sorting protein [Desulfobacterales bacterium]|nr:outer membrane lipoprotein-sorting protein [Desulfobacterales bacterium]